MAAPAGFTERPGSTTRSPEAADGPANRTSRFDGDDRVERIGEVVSVSCLTKSTPRLHLLVPGALFAKSADLTAMPSIAETRWQGAGRSGRGNPAPARVRSHPSRSQPTRRSMLQSDAMASRASSRVSACSDVEPHVFLAPPARKRRASRIASTRENVAFCFVLTCV